MTGSINPPNPLAYEGQVAVPFINRTFPPQSTFNTFPVPTVWIDTSSSDAYILVSKAGGVAVWSPIGGLPGQVESITTPDATVVTPTSGNINFLNGIGTSITGSGSNITFTSTERSLTWSVVTTTTKAMVAFEGYISNTSGGCDFTLPATAAVGDLFSVANIHADGFQIGQNSGQKIQIGKYTTTTGIAGGLRNLEIGDTVLLICTVANTNFLVLNMMGNIEYV